MSYGILTGVQALGQLQQQEARAAVEEVFTYSAWSDEQNEQVRTWLMHSRQRQMEIMIHVPPSPSRTLALNHLIDARMLANAAITHKGKY